MTVSCRDSDDKLKVIATVGDHWLRSWVSMYENKGKAPSKGTAKQGGNAKRHTVRRSSRGKSGNNVKLLGVSESCKKIVREGSGRSHMRIRRQSKLWGAGVWEGSSRLTPTTELLCEEEDIVVG